MDFSQRCSDAERDEALAALSEHHTVGRIDLAEFDQRSDAALAAKTYEDLRQLFADLPDPRPEWLAPGAVAVPTPSAVVAAKPAAVRPKWVTVVQVAIWPVILGIWFGFLPGAWWLIFVAIAVNAGLGALWPDDAPDPDRRQVEK